MTFKIVKKKDIDSKLISLTKKRDIKEDKKDNAFYEHTQTNLR